jgi:hypothetical protein
LFHFWMISGSTSLAGFALKGLSHAGVIRGSKTIAFTPFCAHASSNVGGTKAIKLIPPSAIFLIVSALRTSSHAMSGKNGFSSARAALRQNASIRRNTQASRRLLMLMRCSSRLELGDYAAGGGRSGIGMPKFGFSARPRTHS